MSSTLLPNSSCSLASTIFYIGTLCVPHPHILLHTICILLRLPSQSPGANPSDYLCPSGNVYTWWLLSAPILPLFLPVLSLSEELCLLVCSLVRFFMLNTPIINGYHGYVWGGINSRLIDNYISRNKALCS